MTGDAGQPRVPYQYALVRVVPRVHRGERLNVGVVLHCPQRDWIGARIELDTTRLAAVDPDADVDAITVSLAAVQAATSIDPHHADSPGRRFGWITAPRSTVVQPGPVHTGLTGDPATTMDELFTALVA